MDLKIIKFCAEECERQGSGELSVYDMCVAWEHATDVLRKNPSTPLSLNLIENLGRLVEPYDNKDGFRKIPIGVGNGVEWIEKARWERIPELLTLLIESYYEGKLDPEWRASEYHTSTAHKLSKTAEDQFYYEFENIHPFRDGNGRTGKILYNYLKGTLDNPTLPPNFWGVLNL